MARAKGTGSHWTDKAGRHHWRITIDGKRHEIVHSEADRAKAEFEQLKKRLDKKIDIDGGKQALSQFFEYWLSAVASPNLKESSATDVLNRINRYIAPTLGDYRLCDLTPKLIRNFVNALSAKYARNSVTQALSILKRSLNTAVEEHLLEYNPALSISVPRKRNDDVDEEEDEEAGKAMTPAHVEAFLEAVKGEYFELLYILTLATGLRRGEVLGLRWSDYDRNSIKIRQTVIQVGSKVMFSTPKTRKSRRTIPLSNDLIAMLQQHHVEYLERRLKAVEWIDNDLIFSSRSGSCIQPSNLNRHFRAALRRSGLAGYRFHDLRHTANQNMKDSGVDAKIRAAILGHAGVEVNENIYTHASEDAKRDAITRKKSS